MNHKLKFVVPTETDIDPFLEEKKSSDTDILLTEDQDIKRFKMKLRLSDGKRVLIILCISVWAWMSFTNSGKGFFHMITLPFEQNPNE